jgi:hypothetical protein
VQLNPMTTSIARKNEERKENEKEARPTEAG